MLVDGELVGVAGEEARSFIGPGGAGIVVGARLRTRGADADVPFGAVFGSAGEIVSAVAGVVDLNSACGFGQ